MEMLTNPKKFAGVLGVILLLWFLVGAILFPAFKTAEVSLTDHGEISLIHYRTFLTNQANIIPLANSIILGLLTVAICGIIGTALAFFVHYFAFPAKRIVDKLLLMPLILPGIVVVFAFVQLYGESGLITESIEWLFKLENEPYTFSGLQGILFVHAYTQYVYFYISVSIAIRHIDYSVLESARNLGASKTQIFTSVILPFISPALISSALITFISGIGSFTAPSIIGGGYRVLTTQILFSKANNYMEVAATQVIILTCISLFLFSIFRLYEKKAVFTSSVKGVALQAVTIKSPLVRFLMLSTAGITIITILLPVFAILLLSFVKSETLMVNVFPQEFTNENYLDIFTRSRKFAPFLNSIIMAFIASLLGLFIAIPSSYLLVKTQIKFKWFIEILVMLPWAMPASAIAINIINAYNTPNIFSCNSALVGTFILLPLGYFVRSLPLIVKTTSISFQNLNETFIEASKSLGASQLRTFISIILPMISPGLLAGFLLVFVRSMGEYTISVFLYTPSNKPVSLAVVNGIFEYDIGLAMAYGTLLIVITSILSFMISKFTTATYR